MLTTLQYTTCFMGYSLWVMCSCVCYYGERLSGGTFAERVAQTDHHCPLRSAGTSGTERSSWMWDLERYPYAFDERLAQSVTATPAGLHLYQARMPEGQRRLEGAGAGAF